MLVTAIIVALIGALAWLTAVTIRDACVTCEVESAPHPAATEAAMSDLAWTPLDDRQLERLLNESSG